MNQNLSKQVVLHEIFGEILISMNQKNSFCETYSLLTHIMFHKFVLFNAVWHK